MAQTSLWKIQQAIYTTLNGNVTVDATNIPVYDHVPQSTAFPYITIGSATERPYDTHGRDGKDATFTLQTWSRYAGFKEASRIQEAIDALLDDVQISVTGWTNTVLCKNEFVDRVEEPDGNTRRVIARYRIKVQA